MTVVVSGKDARKAFSNEAGGHRWQRVPPTEKRGRVHTSTVTVAVLAVPTKRELPNINRADLDIKTTRGSGAGGQHKNKTDSAVQMTHKPTGITVYCQSERSQSRNKASALAVMRARIAERQREAHSNGRNDRRRRQVGSGMRGDKRRTIALQRGQVHDHVTGKRMRTKAYLRGEVDRLW